MERSHPNSRRAMFALRVLLILAAAGCSNRQMSASNPFMSPDRVPPPATRTIAPGTAAPYYPGDPIPAAQMTPAPPGAPQFAQAQPPGMPAVQMPSPPVAAAPQAFGAPQAIPSTQAATSPPLEFTNERNVSIPSDGENLRFAVPPPPVTPVQPQAAPIQLAAAPTAAVPQQVMPAAYNQPIASQPAPAASLVPTATADDTTGGPWRAPQVPNKPSPVMQAQYVQPQSPFQTTPQPQLQAVPQAAPGASTMPVQLRAVPPSSTAPMMTVQPQPQPQVAPAMTPPPRMRFPSWTEPSSWFTPQPAEAGPPPGQQLVGYMVPGPNGQMQMVSVEQMQAMSTGAAQPAPSVANADGFRPRGSATK